MFCLCKIILHCLLNLPCSGPEGFDQHLWHHPCPVQGEQQNQTSFKGASHTDDPFIFTDVSIIFPQGQNYNIPISLWLMDTHPYHAPLCFVKPTPDMQIKVNAESLLTDVLLLTKISVFLGEQTCGPQWQDLPALPS